MRKASLLLMIITIFSSLFGFARDITLSYFYGVSNISDAYFISLSIPSIIFGFIGAGISTAYMPMYNKIEQTNGVIKANRFTNNIVNIILVICTIIIILLMIFTRQLVKVFASGFEEDTFALAVHFTKISSIGIYFTGLILLFTGFLQQKGNYKVPALIGFPFNLVIILSIFISSKTNIVFLSIGNLIANITQLILMIPFAKNEGYRYKCILDFKDENIVKIVKLSIPTMLGVSVYQINTIVDRTLASTISVGGISALNYSYKLNFFIQTIFVLSISTVMFPMISKMAAELNMNGFKKAVSEAISGINLLVIPATLGAIIFSEPIVKLLFGRGAFDSQAILMTSDGLLFYSIGLLGFGLWEVLSKAFYSLQDTKTPMINSAISMCMNIILCIVLSKFLGIGGLALATSLSTIFCALLLLIKLRKKIGPLGIRNIFIEFLKISCASFVMGLIAKLAYNLLVANINSVFSLIVSIIIGASVYILIIFFMKVKSFDDIVNAIYRIVKKKL